MDCHSHSATSKYKFVAKACGILILIILITLACVLAIFFLDYKKTAYDNILAEMEPAYAYLNSSVCTDPNVRSKLDKRFDQCACAARLVRQNPHQKSTQIALGMLFVCSSGWCVKVYEDMQFLVRLSMVLVCITILITIRFYFQTERAQKLHNDKENSIPQYSYSKVKAG